MSFPTLVSASRAGAFHLFNGHGRAHERPTIPASEVGVSLTISDKALKEFEKIQQEIVKEALKGKYLLWD